MGKQTSRDLRVYAGAYDPSDHTTHITISLAADPLDVTAFSHAGENCTAGLRKDTVEWAGMYDDATSGMDAAAAALIGSGTNNAFSVMVGSATGNPAFAGTGFIIQHAMEGGVAGLAQSVIKFQPNGSMGRGAHYGFKATCASNYVSGSVDNGTASTAGGTWYVHVLSAVAGTSALALSDSADGTSFSAIGSLVNITAVGASAISIAGTIRQYTRIANGSGAATGTISAAFVLVRN